MLTVSSEVVSAGLLRVFGQDVAELPLVATAKECRGKVRPSRDLGMAISMMKLNLDFLLI